MPFMIIHLIVGGNRSIYAELYYKAIRVCFSLHRK